MSNKELQLLVETLNNGSEAEADGVKYIYMDENTVYRFENNRMKKVAAGLIKKANKLIKAQQQDEGNSAELAQARPARQPKQQQYTDDESGALSRYGEDDDDLPPLQPKPKPRKKQTAPKPSRYLEPDDEEGEPVDDEEEKPIKKINKRLKKDASNSAAPNVDLNEYYHTKNKLEFMTLELDRLNNKVSKLKQYKNIVNKITGGEYDQPLQYNDQQQITQAEPPQLTQTTGKRYNDSLFMF